MNPRSLVGAIAALLLIAVGLLPFWHVFGAEVPNRYLQLDDSSASAATTYDVGFDLVTSGPVGSLRVQFCSNAPIIGTPCTAPSGFDVSGTVLGTQTGLGGFSVSPLTTNNVLILTRTPFNAGPTRVNIELTNVVSPDTDGSYYARYETFASTDATGSHTDYGGVAFHINSPVNITTTVPPYLLFCTGLVISNFDCTTASGDYLNFGELSSASARTGSSQIVIATNAGNGYGVWYDGTTMESGNNIIPAIPSNDVSRPGTSQFGLNLVKNTSPAVGANPSGPGSGIVLANYSEHDRFHFVAGDQIIASISSDDYRKYTVSYLVNVAHDQPAGIYVSTITYTCLANF